MKLRNLLLQIIAIFVVIFSISCQTGSDDEEAFQEGVKVIDGCTYLYTKEIVILVKAEKNITTVNIPDGVISIRNDVFSECNTLTSLTIPTSVKSIDDWAFWGCRSLESFDVNENNLLYSSSEDKKILFNKDKTILIAYPTATDAVEIPEGVTNIGVGAFNYCCNLTELTIPASVTSIGNLAFTCCYNLRTVNYKGTEEQWKAISGSDSLKNITINYGK
jgi:hypothetical protein